MVIKKVIATLLMATMFISCASLQTGVQDPTAQAAAKIAIQYGVMKYIDEDAEKAQRVLTFVDAALAVAGDETASVDDMQIKITALIPFDKLDLADRVLIASLIEAAVTEVKRRVDTDPTKPLVEVRTVLTWVKQAAQLSQPR